MSTIEKYKEDRATLIASERALRFDAVAIASASENETRAAEIVHKLKTREAKDIWNAKKEQFMYPGMEFLFAKDTIMSTELYKIMKKMPKGGLLRGYMDAMCDANFLYKMALEYPNIHIRVTAAITADPRLPLPQFKPLSADLTAQHAEAVSLTSSSYVPGSWVPLSTARRDFALGGPEAFDKWIVGSMMIDPKEAYIEYNTSTEIWEKFRSTFDVVGGIIFYEPILKRYMRQILLSSIEDGTSYVELRMNFYFKAGIREDGSEAMIHRDWMVLFSEAVEEVKANMKKQGREDEFVGARIIYVTLRSVTNAKLAKHIDECMALKEEFPDLIAGFDLGGSPSTSRSAAFQIDAVDTGHPLIYFIESLLGFQAETKKRRLDIPFVFHVGETLDDGGAADCNIYDALLLGTKRIGHGFSLAKHPLLMKMCKERGVLIEVCPISNQIMRLTSSMQVHPLSVLLNSGLALALCPDNPSVFGNMGLSSEFYHVIAASEITSLLGLGQLARQSLEHSLLNDKDKTKAIQLWEKRWKVFIEDIVSSYPR